MPLAAPHDDSDMLAKVQSVMPLDTSSPSLDKLGFASQPHGDSEENVDAPRPKDGLQRRKTAARKMVDEAKAKWAAKHITEPAMTSTDGGLIHR